jgi:hypothetical protein
MHSSTKNEPSLEQRLERAVNEYEDHLDENPGYEPSNIRRVLDGGEAKHSLEVIYGSRVAAQTRYDDAITREHTAYFLTRFYKGREAWADFTPGKDAAVNAVHYGGWTAAGLTFATGPSLPVLALTGFAAVTAAGSTLINQYLQPKDRKWLDAKTDEDIERTAANIRDQSGPNDPGSPRDTHPVSPDGTNVYNPSTTPV